MLIVLPTEMRLKDMRGVEPLTVSTEAITGLKVAAVRAGAISGTAEMEGKPMAGVSVSVLSNSLDVLTSPMQATNASGAFRFEGAVKGLTYQMNVAPPKGAYVSSVTQGDSNLAGPPFSVSAEGGPIRVVLRDDGGEIEGKVLRNRAPAPRAFVVLAPVDARKNFALRSVDAKADGSFEVRDIAPGPYRLFALDRNDDDLYYEPDYLARFRAQAVEVSVAPRGTKQLETQAIDTQAHGQ